MGMPTITTEVALTTNPGATPTWTDISAYQENFVVHRGRADDQSAFGPGQLQLTLANEDRRFDPAYTSSPYSPNVVPMRRIRIRATYNTVTYDIFNGYVTNWRQTYSPPQVAKCVVDATDAFKVLGNIELPVSVYVTEVVADGPRSWYRLDDVAGSTSVLDAVAGNNAPVDGALTFKAAGLVNRDPGASITPVPVVVSGSVATPAGIHPPAAAMPLGTGPFTIEWMINAGTGVSGADQPLLIIEGGATDDRFSVGIGPTGTAGIWVRRAEAGYPSSSFQLFTTGVPIVDGADHHLALTRSGSTVTLYFDGVSVGMVTNAANLGPAAYFGSVGVTPTAVRQDMRLSNLAFYDTALSAGRIAAHHTAAHTPWNGDTSGARVNRILDAAGWPAADRNIDTGQAILQSATLLPVTLANLQKIEQTEQGALFVTAAGLVRFIARNSLLAAPYATSQGTFGDSGSELEYGDLTYIYDDGLIFNEVYVSRSGGTVVVVKDTASQTKYLRRTKTLDGLLHQSDLTSVDLANWVLNHYKDPTLRVTGMRLEPSRGNEATHFPHVLGRELMDRVTVLRRPQNLGAAISQDTLIEGITHTVTAVDWVTTWNLSPAEAQAYWIAGVVGFSEAGQTTRAGF